MPSVAPEQETPEVLNKPSDAGAPAPKSRKQEQHDAIDRLMGGELTRAEERCATEQAEKREACVDAHLAAHGQKLEAEATSSLRSLELLSEYGRQRCKAAPDEKKEECSMRAMNALITKLGEGCPPGETDEGHRCIVEKVIQQLGP